MLLEIFYSLARANRLLEDVMTTQNELVTQITALTATVAKIGTETTFLKESVAALQTQLAEAGGAGGTITPELQAAVEALAAQIQVVDALVPDAVPA